MSKEHRAVPAALLSAALLAGCAEPPFQTDPASDALHTVRTADLETLREPGPDEVVIVINANSGMGVHAGMFAGDRLYDPSGTYLRKREDDPAWQRPALADYLAFQLHDGPRVRVYRFELSDEDFAAIRARIDGAGWTLPTACAKSVRNVIAGIGPFKAIQDDGWVSPKRLASQLAPIENQTTTTH